MADTVAPDRAGPSIGQVVDGRYRVVELLGEGGMGAVYVAEHLTLRKQVALKTIRSEFAASSQHEARFAREALATAQLDHPHVASAIDFGRLPDGGAYLVTQLVRGEGLHKRMRAGTLTWPEVCELGAQVADALAAAHEAGIVHRDLKPDNVLLEQRRDGSLHARVVDFGIAHVSGSGAAADSSQPITRMGAVIGTPGYMAPEQATGGTIDARVDIYALGVILWECCAGQPLWEGESLSQMFIAQLTRPAPSLRAGVPELPEALAGLIDRMLARTPAERPATALAVRDELRRLAREARAPAPSPSPAASLSLPLAGPGTSLSMPTEVRRPPPGAGTTIGDTPRRRGRGLVIAGVAVGLVVLAWLVAGGEGAAPPASPGPSVAGKPTAPGVPARPREKRELPARRELLAELPAAYVDHGRVLLLSTEGPERAKAGAAIVASEGDDRAKIPAYFHQLAAFEVARGCEAKQAILQELGAMGDVRVLWALRIVSEMPKDGCRGRDCFGCLRADLRRILDDLEGSVAEDG